jgi:LPXTG-motif cell wall-anchored protein
MCEVPESDGIVTTFRLWAMTIRTASILAAGAAALIVFPAAPGFAEPGGEAGLPEINYLVNRADGECLTLDGLSQPTAPLAVVGCTASRTGSGQGWYWHGEEMILSIDSGQYLEVPHRKLEAGDKVRAATASGGHNQEWRYDPVTGQLYPKDYPDMSLDNTDAVTMEPWTGAADQQWDFVASLAEAKPPVSPSVISPQIEDRSSAAAADAAGTTEGSSDDEAAAPAADTLPITGARVGWLAAGGAGIAIAAGLAFVIFRGRRRMLRGAGYW